ncbi:MAG TPA: hypothetical protein VK324_14540 [Tepidisphaeraceae bacterium]|nr:hypothetical protein [Tepidisphaeraceae bacterium]
MLVTAIVAGLCSLLFVVLQTSPLVEIEITLGATLVVLMAFLTVGLYRGARVHKGQPPTAFNGMELGNVGRHWDGTLPDLDIGDADGCLGAAVAALLWILVGVLLVFVLWGLLNVFIAILLTAAAGLYWIFYRALRQIIVRGRRCRGNLGLSMVYAAFFTLLYAGWLVGVLAGAAWVAGVKTPG